MVQLLPYWTIPTCGNRKCSFKQIRFGVWRSSRFMLGPLLFSIYTSQLFDIVSKHLPNVHCYADDTQLYLSFKPDNEASQLAALVAMEACIEDIRRWMIHDKLMLNDDKTEFLLIGTRQQLEKIQIDNLSIGDSAVPASNLARNLVSWFDNNMTMVTHITKTCKSAFYWLHNLNRIRKYLNKHDTETLLRALLTSRLDYCNSLLYGLPNTQLSKLQRVQNAAARLAYRAPRFCHISPLLFQLHWLPIRFRIDFKIILLCFKANTWVSSYVYF